MGQLQGFTCRRPKKVFPLSIRKTFGSLSASLSFQTVVKPYNLQSHILGKNQELLTIHITSVYPDKETDGNCMMCKRRKLDSRLQPCPGTKESD